MSELESLVEELSDMNRRRADRVLDGRIFKAIEETGDDIWRQFDDVWHRQDPDDKVAFDPPPHYTSSVDEAMKIVPAFDVERCGVWWRMNQTGGSNGSGKNFYIANVHVIIDTISKDFIGMGDAAIALTTAALRARLALSKGRSEWTPDAA